MSLSLSSLYSTLFVYFNQFLIYTKNQYSNKIFNTKDWCASSIFIRANWYSYYSVFGSCYLVNRNVHRRLWFKFSYLNNNCLFVTSRNICTRLLPLILLTLWIKHVNVRNSSTFFVIPTIAIISRRSNNDRNISIASFTVTKINDTFE